MPRDRAWYKNEYCRIEIETRNPASTTEYVEYIAAVRDLLERLSPEERLEVFYEFCIHCGTDDPCCQCQNDE